MEFVHLANRTQDIVFVRNTVPGHPKCKELVEPFKKYAESQANADYSERPHSIFNWPMFPMYNRYLDSVINEHKAKSHTGMGEKSFRDAQHKVLVELLDVYPMTILRPDGHILPARTTWWNSTCCQINVKAAPRKNPHGPKIVCTIRCQGPLIGGRTLLFSTLQDIAAVRTQTRR
jgi:hypothetical protein